jgi:hypothetical protein
MCFSFKYEIICIIINNPPFKKLKKILEIRLEELIRGCCKNKKSAQYYFGVYSGINLNF